VCFLPVSHLSFLWCALYLLGTGLGGWQRKSLQRATIARTAAWKRSKMYAAIV